METIVYKQENNISSNEFIELLKASTLAERRPVDSLDRISKMLAHGNLIITARQGEKLIGIARSISDFAFCTYLSDLAVHEDYQRKGIGVELIRRTKLASPEAKLILLSAPKAIAYYPKIGMTRHEHCYTLDDVNALIG